MRAALSDAWPALARFGIGPGNFADYSVAELNGYMVEG